MVLPSDPLSTISAGDLPQLVANASWRLSRAFSKLHALHTDESTGC